MRPIAAAISAAIALTACAGGDDAATDLAAAEATFDDATSFEMSGEDIAADDGGSLDADVPFEGGVAAAPVEGGFDIGVIGRDVIIEMGVVVSSDDIQRTVASVTASASALGGGVASSDVNYGSVGANDGSALLVVKVPPGAVDRLLAKLDDTGTVQSINQSAQDVTEQLVDLDVRIANARTSVDNVREFMDRTENLNELVSLEAELTRRQTDLEQLEARKRNLADRVALSTITIQVVPTASVPEPIDDDQSIGDAFRSGWEAFAGFLFGVGFVLAASAPFLALGLVLAVAAWLWVRRRDSRSTATGAVLHGPVHHEPPSDEDAVRPVDDRDSEPAN